MTDMRIAIAGLGNGAFWPSHSSVLVDDQANVRRSMALLLEQDGHSVVEASTAAEALQKIHRVRRLAHLVHGVFRRGRYLMHTARTCWMSVNPCSTFSIPSCFRVRIPSSSARANNSAT